MKRFIEGEDRSQSTLFPERLEDYSSEDDPVRAIEAFVEELDLGDLGFDGTGPEVTSRPAYHPSTLLKIYIYGYLNRIQSSRRLEREAQRNLELIWLTGKLMPDFKTIADFRKDNGQAIRGACREFVTLSRSPLPSAMPARWRSSSQPLSSRRAILGSPLYHSSCLNECCSTSILLFIGS